MLTDTTPETTQSRRSKPADPGPPEAARQPISAGQANSTQSNHRPAAEPGKVMAPGTNPEITHSSEGQAQEACRFRACLRCQPRLVTRELKVIRGQADPERGAARGPSTGSGAAANPARDRLANTHGDERPGPARRPPFVPREKPQRCPSVAVRASPGTTTMSRRCCPGSDAGPSLSLRGRWEQQRRDIVAAQPRRLRLMPGWPGPGLATLGRPSRGSERGRRKSRNSGTTPR